MLLLCWWQHGCTLHIGFKWLGLKCVHLPSIISQRYIYSFWLYLHIVSITYFNFIKVCIIVYICNALADAWAKYMLSDCWAVNAINRWQGEALLWWRAEGGVLERLGGNRDVHHHLHDVQKYLQFAWRNDKLPFYKRHHDLKIKHTVLRI